MSLADSPRDPFDFPNHEGKATWGERLVPLEEFRRAAAAATTGDEARERPAADPTPVEGPYRRVAVFGGVYSNHYALQALLDEAARRGAEAIYCLGDLGGFGPNPERILPLLRQGGVRTIQGNYEQSLASGAEDCNCGYTDPSDNHFASLSYDYTAKHCSDEFKSWMGHLPARRRIRVGERELLLAHGSPRRVNEFLFESTAPEPFLQRLLEEQRCDGFLCTHTGLHWHRRLAGGGDVINVGVIGRPANDGRTCVRWCMLEDRDGALSVELLPLEYDHEGLAREMRDERLPEEFVETVLTGWWTTCLEILPARERERSRF